jgi:hypothetical protein
MDPLASASSGALDAGLHDALWQHSTRNSRVSHGQPRMPGPWREAKQLLYEVPTSYVLIIVKHTVRDIGCGALLKTPEPRQSNAGYADPAPATWLELGGERSHITTKPEAIVIGAMPLLRTCSREQEASSK